MPTIKTSIEISAPRETVFDLARSIDLHVHSTAQTNERAVAGVTSGLIGLDQRVTWEATHFFIRQRLTVEITQFDQPNHFRDSMVKGIFKHSIMITTSKKPTQALKCEMFLPIHRHMEC